MTRQAVNPTMSRDSMGVRQARESAQCAKESGITIDPTLLKEAPRSGIMHSGPTRTHDSSMGLEHGSKSKGLDTRALQANRNKPCAVQKCSQDVCEPLVTRVKAHPNTHVSASKHLIRGSRVDEHKERRRTAPIDEMATVTCLHSSRRAHIHA